MMTRFLLFLLTVHHFPGPCLATVQTESPGTEKRGKPDYLREIAPILRKHCFRCHGADQQKAEIRLDTLSINLEKDRAAAETWHEVLNAVQAGEMPPEAEPPLSTRERKKLTLWLRQSIKDAVDSQRDTTGRVVLRRLTRTEYSRTMTDLLGLKMDYSRDLPPDAISPDGFNNNGNSLRISPLQLETYLNTARRALKRVVVEGPVPEAYQFEFREPNVKKWLGKPQFSRRLGRQQEFLARINKDYPEVGDFRILVRLSAELKEDSGYPILEVGVGYRPDTEILFREFEPVEIRSAKEQTLVFEGRIEDFPLPVRGQGKYPGLVIRIRNIYDNGSRLPRGENRKNSGMVYPEEPGMPLLEIQSVTLEGPVLDGWPPERHRRILFESPIRQKNETEYVQAVLERFMSRAYRRPVTPAEVERILSFHVAIRSEFPTLEEALRETLAMILVRPEFLYLLEAESEGGIPEGKREINAWELANRLSYFLWGTLPDETLREKAASGQLLNAKTREAEAKRLAERVARYRVFPDDAGKANLNVREALGSVLVVPQFTLAAETRKGNRPSFSHALPPEQARVLVKIFAQVLRELGLLVAEGVFGAEMLVELTNHGPATYLLEVG